MGALVDHQRVVHLELAVWRQDRGVDEHAFGVPVFPGAAVSEHPRRGQALGAQRLGLHDTVQFVESAASVGVWVKLNAFPAASTAFAPARPARPAGLFGGMPKSAAVAGLAAWPLSRMPTGRRVLPQPSSLPRERWSRRLKENLGGGGGGGKKGANPAGAGALYLAAKPER